MSQYEIVEEIFNAKSTLTFEQLKNRIQLHPSTIKAHLDLCIKKGYVIETSSGYQLSDDFDDSNLEEIRPRTLDELMGGKNDR